MSELTRRELLVRSAGAAGAAWLGGVLPGLDLLAAGSAEAARESGPLAGGERLGTVPFVGEGSGALGEVVGSGPTGRLAYDLVRLRPEETVVSRDEFYVRTLAPAHLPPAEPWSIQEGDTPLSRLLTFLGAPTPGYRDSRGRLARARGPVEACRSRRLASVGVGAAFGAP